eukprot:g31461.t1
MIIKKINSAVHGLWTRVREPSRFWAGVEGDSQKILTQEKSSLPKQKFKNFFSIVGSSHYNSVGFAFRIAWASDLHVSQAKKRFFRDCNSRLKGAKPAFSGLKPFEYI